MDIFNIIVFGCNLFVLKYLDECVTCVRGQHKWVHIFSHFCPGLLAAAPLSVLKVTSRRERVARRSRVGRRRGCRGHKEQDTGSGERWRGGRQCDAQGCWTGGGEEKSKQRREEAEKECWKSRRRTQGVCIWHWEAGKDSVGQAGRTCVFVFDWRGMWDRDPSLAQFCWNAAMARWTLKHMQAVDTQTYAHNLTLSTELASELKWEGTRGQAVTEESILL